ncbi:MAG: glucose-1-phosphate cytidylyltransferase [Magnetococcales bacterium]|nr:glucose-1-phosphate cytidylyltransferase [Magnetococcales bacterium]
MKVIILAGGLGTRIGEETAFRPKPLVEIGGMPILWHIMKIYSSFGLNEFVICCGYKGYMIKEFFSNYFLHCSDVTFDMTSNSMEVHRCLAEPWRVTLVSTGEKTQTGGRLKRVRSYVADEEAFCFTYGDGLGNVNIPQLLDFHRQSGTLATMTAVQPMGRFGALNMAGNKVLSFEEKPKGDGRWINGGFFVLSPKVIDYIEGDSSIWERDALEQLARGGELSAYHHHDFWHPMDSLRDKEVLNALWDSNKAPWKTW